MGARVIATDYGRRALDSLASVVHEAKQGDAMAAVTILLPNNTAGIVARRHLAAQNHGIAGISLVTLSRLAEQLAASTLAPRRPVTGPILAAAWRAALDRDPGAFAAVSDHAATIRALSSAHRELRDLTGDALELISRAGGLSADVVRLHRSVAGSLRPGWYDATDLLHRATELVPELPEVVGEHGRLVLYAPQELTQAEAGFARALAEHAELVVIAAMTADETADAAISTTIHRLGLEVAAAGASARPDAATPSAPHHAHRIVHASDSDDEIRCVIREIVAALRTTPAHRIAVLFATASPYARLLHEQLDAAGIAFNGPGPRPVHERALARGFLEIVTLDCVELPRADLFVALAEAPVRGFDGGQIPVSRWERVSRSAGIVGGHEWKQRLEALVESQEQLIASELAGRDPYQGRIDAARREIESARDLLAFVTAIRQRLEEGRALTTWLSLGEWAGRLLTDLYGTTADQARLPAEEQYAAAAVQRAVAGLAALGEFETEATVHGLGEAVAMELEAALPRVGRFGEGVFVGPVSSAIGLDADLVYVVGLAEDAYPGRMREDPLLPERVRRLTNGQLTATRERIGRRLRNLLAAFAAAPAVVACFPRGDLRRSTHRLPSRWLLPTFHELTGDQLLTATDWESASTSTITGSPSYAASLMATPQPANAQEWRVRAALADPSSQGDDAAVRAALALMRARGGVAFSRFDGNLAGQPGLPDFAAGTRRVSPTALESFAVCPHAYFVQRMLRVEPLEQPEQVVTISPLDVGNLVHASMDEFVKSCGTELPGYGQPWSAAQRARLRDIATNNAAKFERRGLTGHRVLWERELGLILGDIDTMLDDDDAWRAEHDARVLASELTFGRKGEPPVVIAVPSGNVAMVGSADKVDETRNGTLLVTDIKTGRAQSFKAIDDDPVVAGTKLQLPVYAYAARQLLGNLAGPGGHLDQVEAQYWFVRRDRGTRVSITLDQELEDTYAHAVGTLVTAIASGQFPAKAPEAPDFAWVQCNYCNPDGLGHGDVRERWERKRHAAELSELVSLIDPAALSVEAGNDG